MTADEYMPIVAVTIAIYVWGALNRGWASPVDIAVGILCWRGVHRWCGHEDAWSDDDAPLNEGDAPPMSTQDAHHGPLRTPPPLNGPLAGPAPDLATHHRVTHDPDSQDQQPGETRIAWTRRQMEAGLLSRSEIDELGAAKFGVHKDTVRRWRRGLGDPKDGDDDQPTPGRRPATGRTP